MNDSEWTDAHRRQVRMVYGMATGGFLMTAGVVVLIYGMTNDLINDAPVLALGGGLVLCGLVAGAPATWMPILSALLKKIPWGRKNGGITATLPKLERDNDNTNGG